MIQRIQTVHLLIVVALMVTMLFPNYATIRLGSTMPVGTSENVSPDGTITRVIVPEGVEEEITFSLFDGVQLNGQQVIPTVYVAILIILAIAVALVTIFLYHKRWIQIRLCLVLAVLMLGIEAFIVLYIYKLQDMLDEMMRDYAIKYSVVDIFPIVALLFVYFAFRGISKDIALVKSLDRIR